MATVSSSVFNKVAAAKKPATAASALAKKPLVNSNPATYPTPKPAAPKPVTAASLRGSLINSNPATYPNQQSWVTPQMPKAPSPLPKRPNYGDVPIPMMSMPPARPPSMSNPPAKTPTPAQPKPTTQIGPPWSMTNIPQTTPPPPHTPGMPSTPGGDSTCGAGSCASTPRTPGMPSTPPPTSGPPPVQTHTPPGVTPGGAPAAPPTPVPLGGSLDMSQLAGVLAGMVPNSQSQSVYVNGGQQGQQLPFQAGHGFRGKDPALQNGAGGNYLDQLWKGFW